MLYLTGFLTWLGTGTNGFLFAASSSAFGFMLMIALFLINAIRKLDLARLFYDTGGKEVSSTKFWHVVACFVATVSFLFINFAAPGSAGLEFIWLTYLGVIAGSVSVSKLISAKYPAVVNVPTPMAYVGSGQGEEPEPTYNPALAGQ